MNPYSTHLAAATLKIPRLFTAVSVILITIVAGIGPSTAYDLNTIPTAEIPVDQNPPQQDACVSYGQGFTLVGGNFCSKVWGSVTGYGYKEFTDTDIVLIGTRLPTPLLPGVGVPMAFYFIDNVSDKTRDPAFGAVGSADLLVKRETSYGSLTAFLRVVVDGGSTYDEQGNLHVGIRDNSYYLGALDEAWIQLDGLKVGVQPSLFGFNRLPSTVTPGYTSIVTTPAISYTYALTPNATLSVSAEDSGRRTFGDGVLARPERATLPDAVALFRFATPSTLVHFSGAIHESNDEVLRDFAGGPTKTITGYALSAGFQSRINWKDFIGEKADGVYGRLGLSFADARGALGYLGIPMFAPDYVVMSDGSSQLSSGWSAVASYEHMLTPNLKFSTNFSYFKVKMQSSPEPIMPADPIMGALPGVDFDVRVKGSILEAGLEYIPMPRLILGIEGGYTWTEAQGRYVNVDGGRISVGFPQIGVYVTKLF